MALVEPLYDAIVEGEAEAALAAVSAQLSAGADPITLIADTMIPAMDEVGQLYQEEQYFIAELMLSGRAMKAAMEPLRPLLATSGAKPAGVVVAGAVKGDLHDIGKNLVCAMLEGGGFEVFDLGVNVAPEKFIAKVKETGATVVGMSALLTTTMPAMKLTIEAFAKEGMRERIKFMVGGAPVTQRFADTIGADGYAENAPGAVVLAKKLIGAAA